MPSYFVNEPSQTTFLPADFEETAIEMTQPGGGASFSRDDGEATLVGTIPYEKIRSARNQILGYAWADDSTPWALHRVPPWRHPIFPEQRASDVHFQGYNPEGVATNPHREPRLDAAVPTDTLSRFVRYSRAVTTIRFKPYPYLFLTDTQLAGAAEYNRNTAIFDTLDPVLELLLAESQPFLSWIDVGAPPGDLNAPVPEYIAKCLFVIATFDVPWEFIANPFIPSKIMACIGKANGTDDWLNGGVPGNGFPKGTLLLEAPRVKQKLQPIWTINDRSPKLVDLYFPFKYVSPTPAATSPTYRGWNLFPFSRTGKFWSVGRKDSTDVPKAPYIPFANFDAMWTHVNSPVAP